jgi:uncharacterized protein
LFAGLPAIVITGPRASGKTTTARRMARTTVRLDRDLEAEPFRADPDGVLATLDPPVLLDEWQAVPGVLGAVKRAVDDDEGVGRFLMTGSVRADMVAESWAATGRVVRVAQWGMTERELRGRVTAPSFFDRLVDSGLDDLQPAADGVDLCGYVELALRGGYPQVALQPSAALRRRWLAAYVDQLVLRDAALHDQDRDPTKLRRYLTALAANNAGVVEHKTVFDAAQATRLTAVAYDGLLEMLFVTEQLPAWHSNRLNRLTRTAKRYLTEPALLGPLLGIDERGALRNGDILGRTLDSFVVSQLRPEIEVAEWQPRLHHLRQEGGAHEVDVIAEYPGGKVVAIEIKSSSAPQAADARHLVWLRDQLGADFIAGIVFHTGPRIIRLGDRISALPISCIWG